jgi:hypothetical protein
MADLPATDLRVNVLTLAVPNERLAGIGYAVRSLLPAEEYDPGFAGQYLQTTYFDTPCLKLRKTRLKKNKYLTLRVRCYAPTQPPGRNYPDGVYALSAKTEAGKFRVPLPDADAEALLAPGVADRLELLGDYLGASLLARLYELLADCDCCSAIGPAVTVCQTRYAVESTTDRITLDCAITTSNGKVFPTSILEVKTTAQPYQPPEAVMKWGLSPIKVSKFLWATTYGVR